MTDNALKVLLEEELKQRIGDLLTGVVDEIDVSFSSMSKVIRMIEELGGEEDEDSFETNGWDYDHWKEITYEGKRYHLSGSGYYGQLTVRLKIDHDLDY